jgi:hypothetical protein
MSVPAHFSFTRSKYDECALNKSNKESTSPFDWVTDKSIVESKEVCFQAASPFMHNPYKSIPKDIIDVESDLRGQNIKLSKCPETKFNPNKSNPVKNKILIECDGKLVPEYTRVGRACNVLSGININRFHPLCEDSQEINKIHQNTYIGTNTRLAIKDAYKK